MDICFVINDQYVLYTGVCLTSLLENQQPEKQINVHILHSDVTLKSQQTLKQLEDRYPCHIQFYDVRGEDTSHFKITIPHITIETYYKLLIPKILKHLDKVLYLDVDMIVLRDLSELWQTNLDNHYAAVAWNVNVQIIGSEHLNNLNFDDHYFNAGMMLLNLKLLHEFSLIDRSIEVLREYGDKLAIQEQDILNIIFKGRCAWVKPSFNLTTAYFKPYTEISERLNRYCPEVTLEDLEHYKQSPHIVHFIGHVKPWHISCVARHSAAYFDYLHKYQGTSSYCRIPLHFILARPFFMIKKRLLIKIIKPILYQKQVYPIARSIYRMTLKPIQHKYRQLMK